METLQSEDELEKKQLALELLGAIFSEGEH